MCARTCNLCEGAFNQHGLVGRFAKANLPDALCIEAAAAKRVKVRGAVGEVHHCCWREMGGDVHTTATGAEHAIIEQQLVDSRKDALEACLLVHLSDEPRTMGNRCPGRSCGALYACVW